MRPTEPVGPVNAAFNIPSIPTRESQRRGEVFAANHVATQIPRSSAYPPVWKHFDHGLNDRLNSFRVSTQRSPALSSRAIQEFMDHTSGLLYHGTPRQSTAAQPPQPGTKRDSLLYDREHREGRIYNKRTQQTPNYDTRRVK